MAPKSRTRATEDTQKSPEKKTARTSSPTSTHCLRQPASPQKHKRRPKPKPPATEQEISAQIAARIAQLSAPSSAAVNSKPPPSVKVKSIAELRSTKIARLTTKIAVNEAEIARLEREYASAKERLEKETVAMKGRKAVDVAAGTGTDGKAGLEDVAGKAQELLKRFRKGELGDRAALDEMKVLLQGAKRDGCDVEGLCEVVEGLDLGGSRGNVVGQGGLVSEDVD